MVLFCLHLLVTVKVKALLSRIQVFATPWTVAPQAPLHGILQAEYWSGLPFPSPGDPPDPGIKPRSPSRQTASSPSEPPGKPLLITDWVHIAVVRIWRTHKQASGIHIFI